MSRARKMNMNRRVSVIIYEIILNKILNQLQSDDSTSSSNDLTDINTNSYYPTPPLKENRVKRQFSPHLTSSFNPNGRIVKQVILWGYPDIKHTYKIIYFAIGDLNAWEIKANVKKIALLSRIGEKTVRNGITKLMNRGLVIRRLNKKGKRKWEYFTKAPNFHDPSFKKMMSKIDDD